MAHKFSKRLISDAHFHLWKPSTHSWLNDKEALANHPVGDLNPVGRDYNIKEFRNESSKYIIDKSVHIQCYHDDLLQETISLQQIAGNKSLSDGHPHGIIAYAELESKDIENTLLKHMRYLHNMFHSLHLQYKISLLKISEFPRHTTVLRLPSKI